MQSMGLLTTSISGLGFGKTYELPNSAKQVIEALEMIVIGGAPRVISNTNEGDHEMCIVHICKQYRRAYDNFGKLGMSHYLSII